jgi:hypothetical protein
MAITAVADINQTTKTFRAIEGIAAVAFASNERD